jgi:hypothetical protein
MQEAVLIADPTASSRDERFTRIVGWSLDDVRCVRRTCGA